MKTTSFLEPLPRLTRRRFFATAASAAAFSLIASPAAFRSAAGSKVRAGGGRALTRGLAASPPAQNVGLNQPIAVYNNWSAYDELSDNIELTESLAMRQLDQIRRLKQTEGTFYPIEQTVDPRWRLAFDALYCGDPRPADVPAFNFWRSQDIYSDHMVRYYEANGIPLERIDNTGFMVGTTGTCYRRGTAAWEGMLILEHARGGWLNQYYGNLELIDERKARWFARVQSLFFPLLALGRTTSFGGLPRRGEAYGFASVDAVGAVYTVVNPSQSFVPLRLPQPYRFQVPLSRGRVLYRDAGYRPELQDDQIELGPEQLAVVGFGRYASREFNLGAGEDVCIPRASQPLPVKIEVAGFNPLRATVQAPAGSDLRLLMRQTVEGLPKRTSGGAPPNGKPLGELLTLRATQDGRVLPLEIRYNKAIWSGLSWASGEINSRHIQPDSPLFIEAASTESSNGRLHLECYAVRY